MSSRLGGWRLTDEADRRSCRPRCSWQADPFGRYAHRQRRADGCWTPYVGGDQGGMWWDLCFAPHAPTAEADKDLGLSLHMGHQELILEPSSLTLTWWTPKGYTETFTMRLGKLTRLQLIPMNELGGRTFVVHAQLFEQGSGLSPSAAVVRMLVPYVYDDALGQFQASLRAKVQAIIERDIFVYEPVPGAARDAGRDAGRDAAGDAAGDAVARPVDQVADQAPDTSSGSTAGSASDTAPDVASDPASAPLPEPATAPAPDPAPDPTPDPAPVPGELPRTRATPNVTVDEQPKPDDVIDAWLLQYGSQRTASADLPPPVAAPPTVASPPAAPASSAVAPPVAVPPTGAPAPARTGVPHAPAGLRTLRLSARLGPEDGDWLSLRPLDDTLSLLEPEAVADAHPSSAEQSSRVDHP